MSLADLPVRLADVEDAAALLEGVIERTPMAHSRALSALIGSEVNLKAENLQRSGSFKVRGAYARMAKLTPEEKARGVVAASAGNHAQGVALAADRLGITARIYMPLGAALPKIAATQDHGAEVILHGSAVDEALVEAQRHAEETGAVFVHPFDHPDIVAGQGTLGLEILDQVPEVDTVITGVGGGGLLAGLAVAVKARAEQLGRPIRVIGVQAENAAAYPPSLAGDALVTLERVSTMADGIAVGKPGQLPFSIIKELADDVVTVSEDALAQALIFLLERNKLVVEPAGAVGVAALLDGRLQQAHPDLGNTVVLLSGGNIDPMLMLKVIQRGLSAAGRYMTIRMMLVDRPGELALISRIISERDANVTGVDHTRIGGSLSMGDVSITIDMETKGHEHCREVLRALEAEGYHPVVVH
ncbi:threonine dehydratase [Kocuria flava]|uniref:threonine ammonia-lyase n=1 Tax=Kocuria flava TaxID=446860 RepID=A0A0U3HVZ3_9MICC|nr:MULTISPECIES: threonine ammonia-lyase [Kocuria]ALU39551.1 threonine dehydratase [Kocuria flava]MCD1144858.1 threonine ammonia-lyase [Kocuria sp. LUK]PLC13305.1 threonine dehydratase [Kocuria flava]GEO92838.1 threonine ammonia-lyase [Kocuria flava]